MAKKRSPNKTATQKEAVSAMATAGQTPSVRDRIYALLNELTDAELNILIYEIENPQEVRSIAKLGRIASTRLQRPRATKELVDMLLDYNIERHPKLETHYLTDKYHLLEYFYEYCM
jgi:hypothetical protein